MNFLNVVFFGEKAKNTVENAYEVEKWLNENSEINSIILVSSCIIYQEV